jgi:glycosyltransferase involved in cell wall biosynthesis
MSLATVAAAEQQLPSPAGEPFLLPGLSVVLPCFNEEDNVADAIRYAAVAASRTSAYYEIVVVDDGSSDRTAEVAARFAAADGRVRLLLHGGNLGYGTAVRSGIRAARMPWILLTDADLQFDLSELDAFVERAGEAELLVGWRIDRRDGLARRFNGAAWSRLVRRLFGLPVRDVDCAFKLMRRDIVQGLPLTSSGAMISTELLVRAMAAGGRITELGVHHRPRVAGEQSGASARVIIRAFRELAVLHGPLRGLRRAAAR